MSFLDKLSKAWTSLRRLNLSDLNRANVHKKLLWLTVAKLPKNFKNLENTERKKKISRDRKTPENQFIQRKKTLIPQTDFIFFVLLRSLYVKMTLPKYEDNIKKRDLMSN